jgi:hypothetical protein
MMRLHPHAMISKLAVHRRLIAGYHGVRAYPKLTIMHPIMASSIDLRKFERVELDKNLPVINPAIERLTEEKIQSRPSGSEKLS